MSGLAAGGARFPAGETLDYPAPIQRFASLGSSGLPLNDISYGHGDVEESDMYADIQYEGRFDDSDYSNSSLPYMKSPIRLQRGTGALSNDSEQRLDLNSQPPANGSPQSSASGSTGQPNREKGIVRHASPQPPRPRSTGAGPAAMQARQDMPVINRAKIGLPEIRLDISAVQKAKYVSEPVDIRNRKDKHAFFDKECSQILEYLFVGSENVAQNLSVLQEAGITHVLNCVGFLCPEYFPNDLYYKTLWLEDTVSEDLLCVLYDVFDYMEEVRKCGGKLYVHCSQGVSRSTSLIIAYLMWNERIEFEVAFRRVKAVRGTASPNMGFACQLLHWQKKILPSMRSAEDEGPVKQMFRIAPHSRYDAMHLVPKLLADPGWDALDPRGAFLVQIEESVFCWIGSACPPMLAARAEEAAHQVMRYEQLQGDVVKVAQGKEPGILVSSLRTMMFKRSNSGDWDDEVLDSDLIRSPLRALPGPSSVEISDVAAEARGGAAGGSDAHVADYSERERFPPSASSNQRGGGGGGGGEGMRRAASRQVKGSGEAAGVRRFETQHKSKSTGGQFKPIRGTVDMIARQLKKNKSELHDKAADGRREASDKKGSKGTNPFMKSFTLTGAIDRMRKKSTDKEQVAQRGPGRTKNEGRRREDTVINKAAEVTGGRKAMTGQFDVGGSRPLSKEELRAMSGTLNNKMAAKGRGGGQEGKWERPLLPPKVAPGIEPSGDYVMPLKGEGNEMSDAARSPLQVSPKPDYDLDFELLEAVARGENPVNTAPNSPATKVLPIEGRGWSEMRSLPDMLPRRSNSLREGRNTSAKLLMAPSGGNSSAILQSEDSLADDRMSGNMTSSWAGAAAAGQGKGSGSGSGNRPRVIRHDSLPPPEALSGFSFRPEGKPRSPLRSDNYFTNSKSMPQMNPGLPSMPVHEAGFGDLGEDLSRMDEEPPYGGEWEGGPMPLKTPRYKPAQRGGFDHLVTSASNSDAEFSQAHDLDNNYLADYGQQETEWGGPIPMKTPRHKPAQQGFDHLMASSSTSEAELTRSGDVDDDFSQDYSTDDHGSQQAWGQALPLKTPRHKPAQLGFDHFTETSPTEMMRSPSRSGFEPRRSSRELDREQDADIYGHDVGASSGAYGEEQSYAPPPAASMRSTAKTPRGPRVKPQAPWETDEGAKASGKGQRGRSREKREDEFEVHDRPRSLSPPMFKTASPLKSDASITRVNTEHIGRRSRLKQPPRPSIPSSSSVGKDAPKSSPLKQRVQFQIPGPGGVMRQTSSPLRKR